MENYQLILDKANIDSEFKSLLVGPLYELKFESTTDPKYLTKLLNQLKLNGVELNEDLEEEEVNANEEEMEVNQNPEMEKCAGTTKEKCAGTTKEKCAGTTKEKCAGTTN